MKFTSTSGREKIILNLRVLKFTICVRFDDCKCIKHVLIFFRFAKVAWKYLLYQTYFGYFIPSELTETFWICLLWIRILNSNSIQGRERSGPVCQFKSRIPKEKFVVGQYTPTFLFSGNIDSREKCNRCNFMKSSNHSSFWLLLWSIRLMNYRLMNLWNPSTRSFTVRFSCELLNKHVWTLTSDSLSHR